MLIVQKITQRYDAQQDRIALSVAGANGEQMVLWLTQRLSNGLAGLLTRWLDEALNQRQGGSALQAWEQASAQAQQEPSTPVALTDTVVEALLTSLDLTRSPNGYVIDFKWEEGATARMVLGATELRQWLGILHRLYRPAGWSAQAWPMWLDTDALDSRIAAQSFH